MNLSIRGKLLLTSLGLILVSGIVAEQVAETWLVGKTTDHYRMLTAQRVMTASLAPGRTTPSYAYTSVLSVSNGEATFVTAGDDTRFAPHDLLQLAAATAARNTSGPSPCNLDHCLAVHAEPAEGATLVAITSTGPIASMLARFRALAATVAFFALALSVLMGSYATRLLNHQLRRLLAGARAILRGEKTTELNELPEGRMQQLAGSLNQMADELKTSMADLAEERDQLQTVIEGMDDAVVTVDTGGHVTRFNRRAETLLMLNDDSIGEPLQEQVKLPVKKLLADAAKQHRWAREYELEAPIRATVMAHTTPLPLNRGAVIVVRDVTEVRRLETIRSDFVANVSHELRTPLSVIRANAETLRLGALDDEEQAPIFVNAIERNADRLAALIADLLDLSRIEAGQVELETIPLRVADSLAEALETVQRRADDHDIRIDIDVGDYMVAGDATSLRQILLNLLDNAIKYSPSRGTIYVRARLRNQEGREGHVRVEVEDNGPGIEKVHRSRVFERFYRADAGRSRKLGGTGLGLAIVKHLAELMHGAVGVEPAPERGSIFWVELPLVGDSKPDGEI